MPQQVTRLILVFSFFLIVFFIIRSFFVPESWGEFGHYRGNAIREIAAKEVKYVDAKTCIKCHRENAELLAEGEHASIKCQTCHGPGYKHNEWQESHNNVPIQDTASPAGVTDTSLATVNQSIDSVSTANTSDTIVTKPKSKTPEEFRMFTTDEREFCLRCHKENASRPKKLIKQIDVTDHYNIKKKCVKCHPAHAPNS